MRVTTFQFAGLAGARRAALACLGDGAVLLLAQSFFNQLADLPASAVGSRAVAGASSRSARAARRQRVYGWPRGGRWTSELISRNVELCKMYIGSAQAMFRFWGLFPISASACDLAY